MSTTTAHRSLPLLAALLLVATPALAQDDPNPTPDDAPAAPSSWEDALRNGVNAYVTADYEAVLTHLQPWIAPERLDLIPLDRRLRLLELFAVASLLQQPPRVEDARAAIARLLKDDPAFSFSASLATPESLRLLEDVRESLGIKPQEPQLPPSQTIYIQREVTQHTFPLVFFPFGVGQFQNRQTSKGLFFLVTQAGALGTNVTSFFIVERLRNERGLYSPQNARQARIVQTVQLTSWWIFVGLAIGGIIDAWVYYEDADVQLRTLDSPPPEFFDTPDPAAPSLHWSWRF